MRTSRLVVALLIACACDGAGGDDPVTCGGLREPVDGTCVARTGVSVVVFDGTGEMPYAEACFLEATGLPFETTAPVATDGPCSAEVVSDGELDPAWEYWPLPDFGTLTLAIGAGSPSTLVPGQYFNCVTVDLAQDAIADGDALTLSSTGGSELGAFEVVIAAPPRPTMADLEGPVTPGEPVVVSWEGGPAEVRLVGLTTVGGGHTIRCRDVESPVTISGELTGLLPDGLIDVAASVTRRSYGSVPVEGGTAAATAVRYQWVFAADP